MISLMSYVYNKSMITKVEQKKYSKGMKNTNMVREQ
jgi:hypothetical protein